MRKATKIFLIIGIVVSALNILSSALDIFSGDEVLMISGIITAIFGVVQLALAFAALKHFNAAQCKDDIKTVWKVLTLLFVNLIAGILMFCLKDEHFPGYTAPQTAGSGNLDELSTRLAKLKELFDSGAISQEEYDRQKDILFDTYKF